MVSRRRIARGYPCVPNSAKADNGPSQAKTGAGREEAGLAALVMRTLERKTGFPQVLLDSGLRGNDAAADA
jgi:hypothetical protein